MRRIGTAASVVMILSLALQLVFWWGVLSLVASGVKAGTGKCVEIWPVDSWVGTTWFCPQREGE